MSSQIYFAYGSNLHKGQMKSRCQFSREVAPAKLPGWRLAYSGVLTIVPDENGEVMGALYKVSKSDVRALDRYEGWPRLYTKKSVWVTVENVRRRAFFYVMTGSLIECPPDEYYREVCEEGFANWGLDRKYLDRAEDSAQAAWKAYSGTLYGYDRDDTLYDDIYRTYGYQRTSRRRQDLWWEDAEYDTTANDDYARYIGSYPPLDPDPAEIARWVDDDEAYEKYLREKCTWKLSEATG